MTVEPIRPEDTSIDGMPVGAFTFPGGGEPRRPEHYGLIEAIHQTFERDAEYVPKLEQWGYSYAAWEEADDGGESPLMPCRVADPPHEIDRLARLIVDGEYRRRREQEAQSNG